MNKKEYSLNHIFKGDKGIWAIMFFLITISILVVYSANSNAAFLAEEHNHNFFSPMLTHIKHIVLAITICTLGSHIKPQWYAKLSYALVILAIILLFSAMVSGMRLNGASRWINLMGFSFQPSELARLALINMIAFQLGKRDDYSSKKKAWSILIISGIFCLIIFMDNISTSILLGTIVFLMCLLGGANKKVLMITLSGIIVIVGVLVVGLLSISQDTANKLGGRIGTGRARIVRFFDHKKIEGATDRERLMAEINSLDIGNKDLQKAYSHIAIANGGITGLGAGNSQARYRLPHPYSDFIFSIIIEEYGLIIGSIPILLYIVLFFRIAYISTKTRSFYLKLFIMGIGISIILQAMINIAVACGAIPVTGQPLPFISQGGTSFMINAIYFSCLLSVSSEINTEQEKRESDVSTTGTTTMEISSIPEVDMDIYGNDKEEKTNN